MRKWSSAIREETAMKEVTRGQALEMQARFATDTNWDKLDGDVVQSVISLTREEFGVRFTAFLRNRAQLIVGEPKIVPIDRSIPFNPAAFIGKGWSIWRGPADGNGLTGVEDQDERSLALTQINLADIRLVTCLNDAETVVKGEEKQRRLKADSRVRLDAKIFQTFWENQALIPERFKEKVNGNTQFIYFDGTVLRDSYGNRYVLGLCWGGGAWSWSVIWLDGGWRANGPSAVLASNQS
ncbi:MAG: hypothetical protein A3J47_02645 [Candidatus Yanofskybacteria bacterium RIFCSPHIGHO2_02_FULL_43_22]|uniref:Uncharacterized protein n=1 Tax=Candidatus Yanofskybacteria bacterium RIFCSPHIGHO2_02_FULL_43_22 TaxID=1802681 RepID=A0A1F8FP86_9BACT|nr:MAG: hypothetical protein A3J47_02645 [Candidatus Yanofskybacteria bacterium RIFCSPHIGHO2_02_FULL_43_22]